LAEKDNFLLKTAAWAARILPSPVKRAFYKIPFLSRLIRRSLNEAAPEGITEVKIAAGILKGLTMALDLHTEKDYWLGTYEPDLQSAALQFIKPGMVVYDVGDQPDGCPIGREKRQGAFGALPANIARLTQNVALNTMQDQVQIVHAAVVIDLEVTFLAHASGNGQSGTGRDEHYADHQVTGIALDDFVFQHDNPPPAVIKMDIEGGEGMALAGMPRLLKEARPIFLIELHGQEAARQVWDCLKANHYTLRYMRTGSAPIRSLDELDWKAYVIAAPEP
jgi:FkbM family methyltransferase